VSNVTFSPSDNFLLVSSWDKVCEIKNVHIGAVQTVCRVQCVHVCTGACPQQS